MDLALKKSKIADASQIAISGSKSETNRLLLLKALYPQIEVLNASDSDDSIAMKKALSEDSAIIEVGHAGTAMRFLTAYLAIKGSSVVTLKGSARMHERPIGILVDALRALGAEIEYLGNDGFPPLKITGKKLYSNKISVRADVSSQFLSALLLIAPKLENGLELTLEGEITSRPYLEMTLSLLRQVGIRTQFDGQKIIVSPKAAISATTVEVESDWSSASYFYSIVALSEIGTEITLSAFKENSLQGDRALVDIYQIFGVATEFRGRKITIRKTTNPTVSICDLQLNNNPDLAQTIAVTGFGLGAQCKLSGLHTLRIKETDRLHALKIELEKLGAEVSVTDDSIEVMPNPIKPNVTINTYDDHRMAMAFASLAVKVPLVIADADVVSKSYPDFWEDMSRVGIELSRLDK